MGASKPVCVKCGMPVTRDAMGWMHVLPPMSMAARRKYRHVVKVKS